MRGTRRSEGKLHPFFQEGSDGYSKVGLRGLSYFGACTLQTTALRPPRWVAVTAHYTACDYFDHWVYDNGIFNSLFIEEWTDGFAKDAQWRDARGIMGNDSIITGERPAFYAQWLAHPQYDDYWAAIDLTNQCRNIAVPVLLKGGWFDVFANGTISTFRNLLEAAHESVGNQVRLQMAPACHGPWTCTTLHFPRAPAAMPDMDPSW